jgi:site-specific DNA-methyltransferase (adenine-specific)
MELIIALRKQGWLWTEEYVWHKRNCYPGKWPNRFRDAWERCLHFTRQRVFAMYQDEVRVPVGEWARARLANLSENDKTRWVQSTRSGMDRRVANWVGRETVYPTNVLSLPTECSNKIHAAAFPESLPTWFIRLFTKPGDLVLDPFAGSGTTLVAATKLGRPSIGIDTSTEYCEVARQRLAKLDASLSMPPTTPVYESSSITTQL